MEVSLAMDLKESHLDLETEKVDTHDHIKDNGFGLHDEDSQHTSAEVSTSTSCNSSTPLDDQSALGQTKKSRRGRNLTAKPADSTTYIRRSTRDPSLFVLEKREVKELLQKISENHPDTVVLKIKDHVLADLNHAVMDAIIDALFVNTVCQALYIQNLNKAISNVHIKRLIALFQRKMIWCLNIGENYEVTTSMWEEFCKTLPSTNITHLYASEHVIDIELKNQMRFHIRENRKKHRLHCAIENLPVIERCTHMWWNPINGVKELRGELPTCLDASKAAAPVVLTEKDVAYWQEGRGKGGETRWTFKCLCGETCSSYEHHRYHPVGRMYECSCCSVWSHVDCVLGAHVSDDDLEEMEDLMCHSCRTKVSRAQRKNCEFSSAPCAHRSAKSSQESAMVTAQNKRQSSQRSSSSLSSGVSSSSSATHSTIHSSGWLTDLTKLDWKWTFLCRCLEKCSSYELPLYHPRGQKFVCSNCSNISHVKCIFGERMSESEFEKLAEKLCGTCQSKRRRSVGQVLVALPMYESGRKKPKNTNQENGIVEAVVVESSTKNTE